MARMLTIILCLDLWLVGDAFATTAPLGEKESLRGLNSIVVLVTDLHPGVRHLTREQLETDVKLRLRVAGVPVSAEPAEHLRLPHLYVSVNMTAVPQQSSRDWYMASIMLQLKQKVRLPRRSSTLYASTWDTTLLVAGEANYIRESLRHMVDGFLNDFLEMNPR